MTHAKPVGTVTNHPRGSVVWERERALDDGSILNTSISVPRGAPTVTVNVDDYVTLLTLAGFERKGIADGTAPSWRQQEEPL